MAFHPGLDAWLVFGERGLSSEAIVRKLVYNDVRPGFNDPADPSDFRRCELLLRHVPTLRLGFDRMAEISPRWAALVERWADIANLLEEEVPGIFDGPAPRGGSAPRTYALMNSLERKAG